jgi:hypothetical protein
MLIIQLPNEILLKIINYLPFNSRLNLRLTCKVFYDLILINKSHKLNKSYLNKMKKFIKNVFINSSHKPFNELDVSSKFLI